MYDTRSHRGGWSIILEAAGRWGDPAVVRRLVRAARRDLVRDRCGDWCRAAAAVLDLADDRQRWSVIDFAAVGIRSDDLAGLWSPGLPAALRVEGVEAPDAAVLVNVAPAVRAALPRVCRQSPADIAMADTAGGMVVLAVALHEAAHHVVEGDTAGRTRPTLEVLRLVAPGIRGARRDHHGAAWCWSLAILTARAARVIAPPPPHDWRSWLWEAIEADLTDHAGIPGGAILDTIAEATRRPWHHDPAGDPPPRLVDLFQRHEAAYPGEAA